MNKIILFLKRLFGKRIICPTCHQELTNKADIEWFNQFGECLLCDHIASDK